MTNSLYHANDRCFDFGIEWHEASGGVEHARGGLGLSETLGPGAVGAGGFPEMARSRRAPPPGTAG
jgi:hypothetical protein